MLRNGHSGSLMMVVATASIRCWDKASIPTSDLLLWQLTYSHRGTRTSSLKDLLRELEKEKHNISLLPVRNIPPQTRRLSKIPETKQLVVSTIQDLLSNTMAKILEIKVEQQNRMESLLSQD